MMGRRFLGVSLAVLFLGCDASSVVGTDDAATSADAAHAADAPLLVDGGGDAQIDAATSCAERCDDGAFCNGVERCDPRDPAADARGCVPGASPCGAQACDELGDTCAAGCADADLDGHADHACGGSDCDDTRAAVHPGASEACDGTDDDCDGALDEGVQTAFYRDDDGDGFGRADPIVRACTEPPGFAGAGGDCDDTSPDVHPGAVDACNEVDDDCDGTLDVGCECTSGTSRACGPIDASGAFLTLGICRTGAQDCVDGAWASCSGAVYPEPDDCEEPPVDDDCDGIANEGVDVECFADADGDTYAPIDAVLTRSCPAADPARGGCPVGTTPRAPFDAASADCDDGDARAHPGAVETCDGSDEDCSGAIDDGTGAPRACYADGDGDGYAPSGASSTTSCTCPPGTTALPPLPPDCDDAAAGVHPGAVEICDASGVDENCAMGANEGCSCTPGQMRGCTEPGLCAAGVQICASSGASAAWGPCSIAPQPEICDGRDQSCDGVIDDGFACPFRATRACTNRCGATGMQRCPTSCAGWEVCRADEVCNACDDDEDGDVDETFPCALGDTLPCTTACGTSGQRLCDPDCRGFGVCRAAVETCNFCDDLGDGGDDRGVGTTRTVSASCANVVRDGAHCVLGEHLFLAANQPATVMAGSFGTVRVGWGGVQLRTTLVFEDRVDGHAPEGSLVMAIEGAGEPGRVWLEYDFRAHTVEVWSSTSSTPLATGTVPNYSFAEGSSYAGIPIELWYYPAGIFGAAAWIRAVLPNLGLGAGFHAEGTTSGLRFSA